MAVRVREARKESGMTQEELATAVGVTQAAVTQWETGKSTPTLPVLIRLSETLGCTIDFLAGVPDKDIISEVE